MTPHRATTTLAEQIAAVQHRAAIDVARERDDANARVQADFVQRIGSGLYHALVQAGWRLSVSIKYCGPVVRLDCERITLTNIEIRERRSNDAGYSIEAACGGTACKTQCRPGQLRDAVLCALGWVYMTAGVAAPAIEFDQPE